MAVKIDEIDPIINAAWLNGITVELLSAPGIGKSSRIQQIAKEMAKKIKQPFCLATRHLSTFDPTEAAGLQFIGKRHLRYADNKEMTFESAIGSYPALFPANKDPVYLPDGTVTTVEKGAPNAGLPAGTIPRYGAVFLDELRQSHHDVQKPVARFMDELRIGEWDLRMFEGNWSVFAASNNAEDRSGANKDLAFITNRKLVLQVESSVQILCTYFEETNAVHHNCIAFVRAFPGSVFSDKVPVHDGPFHTPRSFERCSRMLMTMGKDGHLDTSPRAVQVASGFMGPGSGAEYIGFLRRVEDMVTIEEILESPTKARVPDRPDVIWAVVQMMVHHVTEKNGMTLFAYVDRLPQEMQITAVAGIVNKAPKLTYEKDYGAWAIKNKDLLLAAFAADRRLRK